MLPLLVLLAAICDPLATPPGYRWNVDPEARLTDTHALLSVTSSADADRLRRHLRQVLLGTPEVTDALPSVSDVENGVELLGRPLYELAAVRRLTMKAGPVQAEAYVFEARTPDRQLVLYHAGHEGVLSDPVVTSMLLQGHTVVAMYLPLSGPNAANGVEVEVPRVGRMTTRSHEHFRYLPRRERPLRAFLEPPSIVLNHMLRGGRFDSVTMIGFSGGGWAATVAAAIDPRITRSYAIAGTLPMHLRWDDWASWGDWEQVHPDLVENADYMDLYLLAAEGEGRNHTQILNKFDSCCFSVPSVPAYAAAVSERAEEIGGRYEFQLDETAESHTISPCTLERIHGELEEE